MFGFQFFALEDRRSTHHIVVHEHVERVFAEIPLAMGDDDDDTPSSRLECLDTSRGRCEMEYPPKVVSSCFIA